MTSKIAKRLMLYFAVALLVFAGVSGLLFSSLFRRQTMDYQKQQLASRASRMAADLSPLLHNRHGGLGAYLRQLNTIALADAWVVDENRQLVTATGARMGEGGKNMPDAPIVYTDLPADADALITRAFAGETVFSEGFSTFLNAPTFTVGMPIRSDHQVIGVLLLHTPLKATTDAIWQGFTLLGVSLAVALLLALLLALRLSVTFTNPLRKMQVTAGALAKGQYAAKTGVSQQDEIGELALSIDQLGEDLGKTEAQRQKLDKMRQDFVANISHELRTPVTVIRGSLEALQEGVVTDPKEVERYHAELLGETKYLGRLVNDLLDLSRLQNTDFSIEMERVNLTEVLQDALRSAQRLAQAKGVSIAPHFPEEAFPVTGDYGRLRQMLLIVLDNAVKFSPAGAAVEVRREGSTVLVRDSGPGIAAEDLPYIFDRFYKEKSEKNKEGTGLGLAIAKQIAQRHGIALTAESDGKNGTAFLFAFPEQ